MNTPFPSLLAWLGGRSGRKAERRFRVRRLVQIGFAAVCVAMGIQFGRFVSTAQAGHLPLPQRPAGVEAFLPISGLMGLLDYLNRGALNRVHPAASVLVLVAVALAFFLRKSFCSWICPVGFLSEALARFGRWAFGRNFRPWKWIDIPLRGLKYLILLFFLWAIVNMSPIMLDGFIHSGYNKVADVKMGLFFADMSRVGIIILGALVVGSVFIQGVWCRYLCPYGALLGFFSRLSPVKIRRDANACVSCGLCDKACMARIPVSSLPMVKSVECTGCLDCLAVCPKKEALTVGLARRRVSPVAYAAAVVGLFLAGYVGARATGNWHNDIPDAEYVQHIQNINGPQYTH